MFNFENLRVYKEGLEFVSFAYLLTSTFPKQEVFGLTSQFQRAAISIVLNIAEGSSRTKKDFRHFLDLSRGSCYECVAIIQIGREREYISEQDYQKSYELCNKHARMISALKASLR